MAPIHTFANRDAVQRAAINAQGRGRPALTGAELLAGIFPESESHAVWVLAEQDMTRDDAVNFIVHGIAKGAGTLRLSGAEAAVKLQDVD
jgi:ATP-dependent Clp protease ATP-binding subunit ClpA